MSKKKKSDTRAYNALVQGQGFCPLKIKISQLPNEVRLSSLSPARILKCNFKKSYLCCYLQFHYKAIPHWKGKRIPFQTKKIIPASGNL